MEIPQKMSIRQSYRMLIFHRANKRKGLVWGLSLRHTQMAKNEIGACPADSNFLIFPFSQKLSLLYFFTTQMLYFDFKYLNAMP